MKILVHDASRDLVEAMHQHNRMTQVSRNGMLVVPLITDRDLSHAIYPHEWKAGERFDDRFVPDFSSGVVHSVYDFPKELADTSYQAVLEEREVHMRRSYCQIVTGYNGERLQPYRRKSGDRRRCGGEYDHPTSSSFSAPKMGLLRFDRGHSFTIQRASVEVIDGILTTKVEDLLRDDGRCELTQKLTSLPSELEPWMPALTAVLDRYDCDLGSCQGHYHL